MVMQWFVQYGEDSTPYSRRSRCSAVLHDQAVGVQKRKHEGFASQPDGGRQANILHGHKYGRLGRLYQKLCAGDQALLLTGGPRYAAQGKEPLEEVSFDASQKLKLSFRMRRATFCRHCYFSLL